MKPRSSTGLSTEAKTELKQQRRNLLAKSHFGMTRPHRLTQGFSERGAAFIDNSIFPGLKPWELAMIRTKISNAFHTYDTDDAAERRQSPSSRAHAKTVLGTSDPDSLEMDRAKRVLAVAPQRGKPVNVPLDTLLVTLASTWARESKMDPTPRRTNSSSKGGVKWQGAFLQFAEELLELEGVDFTSRAALGKRLVNLKAQLQPK